LLNARPGAQHEKFGPGKRPDPWGRPPGLTEPPADRNADYCFGGGVLESGGGVVVSAGGGVAVVSAGGVVVVLSGAGGAVVESTGGGAVSAGDGLAASCFAQADASSNAPTVRNKTLRFIASPHCWFAFPGQRKTTGRLGVTHAAERRSDISPIVHLEKSPAALSPSERSPSSISRACNPKFGAAKLDHGLLLSCRAQ
jgi:hypothetical protein